MKIAFVGLGNVGKTLAKALHDVGYEISGVMDMKREAAEEVANQLGAGVYETASNLATSADLIFLTVPDREIEKVCSELAISRSFLSGSIVLHASGALSSLSLGTAKSLGCFAASFHPLQTFPDPQSGLRSLAGSIITLEGDEPAVEVCKQLAQKLSCHPIVISTENKALYHAGACVVSNYMVTVVDIGLRILEASGLDAKFTLDAVRPLMEATMQNILKLGTERALTGPVARGDEQTIANHIQAMQQRTPSLVNLYTVLGAATAELAERKNTIDSDQKERLLKNFNQEL